MLHALLVGAAALLHAPALPMRAWTVRMCVAEECDAEEGGGQGPNNKDQRKIRDNRNDKKYQRRIICND